MSERRPIARYYIDGEWRRLKEALPRFVRDNPGLTRPELARLMTDHSAAPYDQVLAAIHYGIRYVVSCAEVRGEGRSGTVWLVGQEE